MTFCFVWEATRRSVCAESLSRRFIHEFAGEFVLMTPGGTRPFTLSRWQLEQGVFKEILFSIKER